MTSFWLSDRQLAMLAGLPRPPSSPFVAHVMPNVAVEGRVPLRPQGGEAAAAQGDERDQAGGAADALPNVDQRHLDAAAAQGGEAAPPAPPGGAARSPTPPALARRREGDVLQRLTVAATDNVNLLQHFLLPLLSALAKVRAFDDKRLLHDAMATPAGQIVEHRAELARLKRARDNGKTATRSRKRQRDEGRARAAAQAAADLERLLQVAEKGLAAAARVQQRVVALAAAPAAVRQEAADPTDEAAGPSSGATPLADPPPPPPSFTPSMLAYAYALAHGEEEDDEEEDDEEEEQAPDSVPAMRRAPDDDDDDEEARTYASPKGKGSATAATQLTRNV